jgi:hypothetical protein
MIDATDSIVRAFARLIALRQNLPEHRLLDESWVREYHGVLDALGALGFRLGEFRVANEHLKTVGVQTHAETQGTPAQYARDAMVLLERSLLFAKLDAVLSYFEFATTATAREKFPVGFRPPSG